ncbi:MAG: hemolysin family protein [Methylobacteriaceae bacterium]|jgi:CBS domain containing-hemolysin-like protein|nr:hemolysin family protein [Methylobacteriaceae bacterium]
MNEDRSRNEHGGETPESGSGTDDSWYEKLLSRVGLKRRESAHESVEDALLDAAEDLDLEFSPHERMMIKNIVGFHNTRVDDVMVPRADIIAVPLDMKLDDLLDVFREAGHSRLPTYQETLDDPKGMVHIRDFLDYMVESSSGGETGSHDFSKLNFNKTIAEAGLQRDVLFVPGAMQAVDLLARMQAKRIHIALVIDEYGGTDGLVSMEDLVETVVGDIEDEHDEATKDITVGEDGALTADGGADLEEVSQILGVDLAEAPNIDDVDTIGGFVMTLAGRVPRKSEKFTGPEGLVFEIVDANPRRIKTVRISRTGISRTAPASRFRVTPERP